MKYAKADIRAPASKEERLPSLLSSGSKKVQRLTEPAALYNMSKYDCSTGDLTHEQASVSSVQPVWNCENGKGSQKS